MIEYDYKNAYNARVKSFRINSTKNIKIYEYPIIFRFKDVGFWSYKILDPATFLKENIPLAIEYRY
jgi:hypothetical protein